MNKPLLLTFISLIILTSCRKNQSLSDSIVSLQIRDRNGFSETISNKDRLKVYQNVDFLSAQPYEKVLRVYGKNNEGKSRSKITSYHDTGGSWQYLECIDGRAHGKFLQWHENGKTNIEGFVIEGLADFSETAQKSWIFEGPCTVWDEQGNIEASFQYDRGQLVDKATYYHSSGKIARTIPYQKGLIHGLLQEFDNEGKVLKAISYTEGIKHGKALSNWDSNHLQYQENYHKGKLLTGIYYDKKGEKISEIKEGKGIRASFHQSELYSTTEYHKGNPKGQVKIFNEKGYLKTHYQIENGMKTGEEWEYYPSKSEEKQPKLLLTWFEDQIQGLVKTWYEDGNIESQREMSGNKKHGLSFAYYFSGDLMMMEEYENDKLLKGSYYKKGEKLPVSEIIKGEGVVTLFNADGQFMKKITYERGKPLID